MNIVILSTVQFRPNLQFSRSAEMVHLSIQESRITLGAAITLKRGGRGTAILQYNHDP